METKSEPTQHPMSERLQPAGIAESAASAKQAQAGATDIRMMSDIDREARAGELDSKELDGVADEDRAGTVSAPPVRIRACLGAGSRNI